MISFFRRALSSWIVIALLVLIAIAFIVTGIGTPTGLGDLGGTGKSLAKVGSARIEEAEATGRIQTQLEAARQANPGLDMTAFVAQGGLDQTIDQMINGRALEIYAKEGGLVASKRLVDGAIAGIPAFQGPTGKFDRAAFLNLLSQRKLTERQVREDFAREAVTRALLIPVTGVARPTTGLVAPYAQLLLEARSGEIAVVPSSAFAGTTPPSQQELSTFYTRNIARYTVPERRVVRYATFDRASLATGLTLTDAEIADYYRKNAATYAGREQRSLSQVIVPTQAAADALAARVRGGQPIAAAAQAAGLEALNIPAVDRAAFTRQTSEPVAAAAFAAAKGSVAAIARSGLGFHVIHVDDIRSVAARPLVEARQEIIPIVTGRKADEAIANLVAQVEDDIADGATFDEVAKKHGLSAATTPPVTAGGIAPDIAGFKVAPDFGPMLRDAFQAATDDDAAVATLGDNRYALYDLDRIVPAAPRPLAQIRAQVLADATQDRGARAAKRAADGIVAAVNKGTPLAEALSTSGAKLEAPRPAGARRLDIARSQTPVPPPVALMFGMVEGRAKVLPLPGRQGWYVVHLTKIDRGDPRQAGPLIAATQAQLARVVGDEYAGQFVEAIKKTVGVTRNDAAIAALKRTLTGAPATP